MFIVVACVLAVGTCWLRHHVDACLVAAMHADACLVAAMRADVCWLRRCLSMRVGCGDACGCVFGCGDARRCVFVAASCRCVLVVASCRCVLVVAACRCISLHVCRSVLPDVLASRNTSPPPHPLPSSWFQVIIADRSPFSAVFYSRSDGGLLEPLIRQYIGELKAAADVHIVTLHLRTRRDLLWSRILERLTREPSRAALREDQAEWMDAVLSFYDGMRWDLTVPNDEISMPSLVGDIFSRLADMEAGVGDAIVASPIVKAHLAAMATPECEASAADVSDDVAMSGMGELVTPVKAKPVRSITAASASTLYSGSASTSPASEADSEGGHGCASPASLTARSTAGAGIGVGFALAGVYNVTPVVAACGGLSARSGGREVAPAPSPQWLEASEEVAQVAAVGV